MGSEAAAGLVFVAVGEVALLLLSFTRRELSGALGHAVGKAASPEARRRSAYLWEAAARDVWLLSALSAIAGFVTILCDSPAGLRGFVSGFGQRATVVAVGIAVAGIMALPALRLGQQAAASAVTADSVPEEPESRQERPWRRVETWLGVALVVALIAWHAAVPGSDPRFRPADWLLHWPAWLIVAGAAIAVALYLGEPGDGRSLTVGLACGGLIGILLGVAEALHGFATAGMERIVGGLMLMLGSCLAGLVGMAVLGLPLQDRAVMAGRQPAGSAASRFVAWLFPVVALIAVAVAAALVLIPVEQRVG